MYEYSLTNIYIDFSFKHQNDNAFHIFRFPMWSHYYPFPQLLLPHSLGLHRHIIRLKARHFVMTAVCFQDGGLAFSVRLTLPRVVMPRN